MPQTARLIEETIAYFGHDRRRIHHFLKVYAFAQTIADTELRDPAQRLIVETAAIVHDVGIKVSEQKYHSSAGRYQEQEGPPVARVLLASLGYEQTVIERVAWLVAHHHHYDGITALDHRILVEADFLVNAEEDALNADAVRILSGKIFVTDTGKRLLDQMFDML